MESLLDQYPWLLAIAIGALVLLGLAVLKRLFVVGVLAALMGLIWVGIGAENQAQLLRWLERGKSAMVDAAQENVKQLPVKQPVLAQSLPVKNPPSDKDH